MSTGGFAIGKLREELIKFHHPQKAMSSTHYCLLCASQPKINVFFLYPQLCLTFILCAFMLTSGEEKVLIKFYVKYIIIT